MRCAITRLTPWQRRSRLKNSFRNWPGVTIGSGFTPPDPDAIWVDVEAYKTGFVASDYADDLPADIARGANRCCLHRRLYHDIAKNRLSAQSCAHVCCRLCRALAADQMADRCQMVLQNLIDGDPASNNLSWQWIASTFANKPYFFNLENVARYAGPDINVSAADNLPLAHSYERLAELLFPNLPSTVVC